MSKQDQCHYPCGCGHFPDVHCSCMDGHTTTPTHAPEPAEQPDEGDGGRSA